MATRKNLRRRGVTRRLRRGGGKGCFGAICRALTFKKKQPSPSPRRAPSAASLERRAAAEQRKATRAAESATRRAAREAAQQQRAEERARIAAMSPEDRAAYEKQKQKAENAKQKKELKRFMIEQGLRDPLLGSNSSSSSNSSANTPTKVELMYQKMLEEVSKKVPNWK